MNEGEFFETVLRPAFAESDGIGAVEVSFGHDSGDGLHTLTVETTEGEEFQVAIAKKRLTEREREVRRIYEESVRLYGIEHTHDFSCCTWRGKNWPGACDCRLAQRTAQA